MLIVFLLWIAKLVLLDHVMNSCLFSIYRSSRGCNPFTMERLGQAASYVETWLLVYWRMAMIHNWFQSKNAWNFFSARVYASPTATA